MVRCAGLIVLSKVTVSVVLVVVVVVPAGGEDDSRASAGGRSRSIRR